MSFNWKSGLADTDSGVFLCYRDRLIGRAIVQQKDMPEAHLRIMPDELLDVELAVFDHTGDGGFVARQMDTFRSMKLNVLIATRRSLILRLASIGSNAFTSCLAALIIKIP